jgi:hypothetical protein
MIRGGQLVADESLESLRHRAGHEVTIRWRDSTAAAIEPPRFFQLDSRSDVVWTGMLRGTVNELVDWLAGRPIDDLSIGRPDLETLFRQFYAPQEAAR